MIKEINLKNVVFFTIPSIMTMLFMAFYTMVDGIFVATLINQTALSAINIAMPVVMLVIAIAMMISSGSNAICAKLLGENMQQYAKQNFSLFVVFGVVVGVIITCVTIVFIEPILSFLGSNDESRQYVYDYLVTYIYFAPIVILQLVAQTALIAAGVPYLSFVAMFVGGISNIILDYVFIAIFDMGISGAGLATGIGNLLGSLVSVVYFMTKCNKRELSFVVPVLRLKQIIKMCINGSSEMVTYLSSAVVTYLFNITMLQIAGNDGVAAITVVLYIHFFVHSVFMGFSIGASPVISYNYGANDASNLRKLFIVNMQFIITISIIMLLVAYAIGKPITNIFLQEGTKAYKLAVDGLLLFSICFLFEGVNIYASAMFTAYTNGKISAFISFLRTFAFINIFIIFLPKVIGINGVWLAVPLAEALTITISIYFINKYKTQYMYAKI